MISQECQNRGVDTTKLVNSMQNSLVQSRDYIKTFEKTYNFVCFYSMPYWNYSEDTFAPLCKNWSGHSYFLFSQVVI